MPDESHEAIVVAEIPSTTVEHHEPEPIELGQWYWVKYKNGEFLECCTHLGSNYVEMTGVNEGNHRVHLDKFYERCRREFNPSAVIAGKVTEQQHEVKRLMGEVEALTARLGVGHTPALAAGASAGAALARLDSNQDVKGYKTALVKAKEEDLPELFRKVEEAHGRMATWMKAELLPLKAQAKQMRSTIKRIDDRIFNVELYAGLVEQVVQITEGDPAEMTEKVRLMQRRHYMDEECLAQYQVGGMEFEDIGEFDDWIADEANRDRLLPFPRCIVAFRVRRYTKEREIPSGFIAMFNFIMTLGSKVAADKLTFLYIRNGDNLYRLSTELEFGARLFPDADHHTLTAGTKLWATSQGGDIITEHQYQGLLEDYARAKAEYAVKKAEQPAKHKAWRKAKKAAKRAGQPFTEREPWLSGFYETDPKERYHPYEPNNIYYDDITKRIAEEIQQANRIAIIIQGLLDRSPVLHPHPPWKIWSEGGAAQALEMIYDDSRALAVGEQPDFEAYRKRLNKSIKAGTVTVGQHAAWLRKEREDDEDRYGGYRSRQGRRRSFYSDHGPGELARVASFQGRAGRCSYAWNREGESRGTYGKKIRCTFTCDVDEVFNVDAYQPGDFRQFFADPRTRADYVKWAPFLLEAEEYHAGNREVQEPVEKVKRTPSLDGQWAYRKRKARMALVTKAVRLVRDVHMQSGTIYKEGTLWRVLYNERGLYIVQINKDGTRMEKGGSIRGMEPRDLEEDPKIPPEPPKPKPVPEPDDDDDDDDEDEDAPDEPEDSDDDEDEFEDTDEPFDDDSDSDSESVEDDADEEGSDE